MPWSCKTGLRLVPHMDESSRLRPRLCQLKKGPNGYGFNLHSDKSKPGQFIRAVEEDTPAYRAGLRPQDKIVQNAENVIECVQRSEVTAEEHSITLYHLLTVTAAVGEIPEAELVLPQKFLTDFISGDLISSSSGSASQALLRLDQVHADVLGVVILTWVRYVGNIPPPGFSCCCSNCG
ncbi:hypothetical protein INR49_028374 [Caranx melampygus]|nr:hypothetical protein INR49_028374 [Caranx melampygus]